MPPPQLKFERRLKLLACAIAAPGAVAVVLLLWSRDHDPLTRWMVLGLVGLGTLVTVALLVQRVVFPLQTLSNLLGGLREGDFSTRARGAAHDDALGEVLLEANALAETLREQRLGALETSALLRTVMAELDAAVFAFDEDSRLRLANRAAENLLRRPAEQLLGRTAAELGLVESLATNDSTLPVTFPGAAGRFGIRRSSFRQAGRPHHLLVLTDLSQALRDEERAAWQRLVRVLGHELNNSLAPIKSLAGSLEALVARDPLPSDWQDDTRRGLAVISGRAESLTRFMDAYAQLAKLPPPRRQSIEVNSLLKRLAALERRIPVVYRPGPDLNFEADPDQIEQLLINLIRNAAEAVLETQENDTAPSPPAIDPVSAIELAWNRRDQEIEITVSDTGPGLANPSNLFVPFFTTKSKGSGIGLTLARQIAENHGGTLTLENRVDQRGCRAHLRLPLVTTESI